METVTPLSPNLWQLSLPFLGEPGIIGSYLLASNNELALIDPGPTTTLDALLSALSVAGFSPSALTHILLTHIHLDHAGSTGSLLQHAPNATVYVHGLGAPHLLNTSRVVASATRIYGDRMPLLWGEILPVPSDRLHVLEDGDLLSVAGRSLEISYTPGHAIHHVIFFDPQSRELFAGDVAGVRLQGLDYVRPPTPPPDLDLEAWSSSIAKMRAKDPSVLYLAHFGPTATVSSHLDRLQQKLFAWGELTLAGLRSGKSEPEILAQLVAQTQPELEALTNDPHVLTRYEIATNYLMTVQGYIRYWQRKYRGRPAF